MVYVNRLTNYTEDTYTITLGMEEVPELASAYGLIAGCGTVGVDLDVTSNTTAGLAVTAMFGDFKSDAADHLDGDLDNYYLTAFVRHSNRSWVHTLIATLGRADAPRTVRLHAARALNFRFWWGCCATVRA